MNKTLIALVLCLALVSAKANLRKSNTVQHSLNAKSSQSSADHNDLLQDKFPDAIDQPTAEILQRDFEDQLRSELTIDDEHKIHVTGFESTQVDDHDNFQVFLDVAIEDENGDAQFWKVDVTVNTVTLAITFDNLELIDFDGEGNDRWDLDNKFPDSISEQDGEHLIHQFFSRVYHDFHLSEHDQFDVHGFHSSEIDAEHHNFWVWVYAGFWFDDAQKHEEVRFDILVNADSLHFEVFNHEFILTNEHHEIKLPHFNNTWPEGTINHDQDQQLQHDFIAGAWHYTDGEAKDIHLLGFNAHPIDGEDYIWAEVGVEIEYHDHYQTYLVDVLIFKDLHIEVLHIEYIPPHHEDGPWDDLYFNNELPEGVSDEDGEHLAHSFYAEAHDYFAIYDAEEFKVHQYNLTWVSDAHELIDAQVLVSIENHEFHYEDHYLVFATAHADSLQVEIDHAEFLDTDHHDHAHGNHQPAH